MADLVLLTPSTPAPAAVATVLPGLALLPHVVTVKGLDPAALLAADHEPDLVLVDLVTDLVAGHGALKTMAALELGPPVLAVLGDSALGLVDHQWSLDDFVVAGAGPAEISARLRLLLSRPRTEPGTSAPGGESTYRDDPSPIRVADVVVDEASWSVRVGGQPLDLTFKEFELLRYLVQHPGRVVTRDVLLQEVWGMDYYGGTRTVDVHIRRLRAKLGSERESLIGTIRGVGYRFSGPRGGDR
ncbi:winged helix-turn-helix transcriptional regulator [Ornithinimicrobium sp. Y1847]|uniref:winged helix-turn-helix transcriptional regulator n=1 Tax=Ornithinimicrobium sp. Y1847 TaxID=3405419 RepID=UPI003B677747